MLWLIFKCSFWVLLGFIFLCELAAIRISGLCSREEERQEALEKHRQQAKSAPQGALFLGINVPPFYQSCALLRNLMVCRWTTNAATGKRGSIPRSGLG